MNRDAPRIKMAPANPPARYKDPLPMGDKSHPAKRPKRDRASSRVRSKSHNHPAYPGANEALQDKIKDLARIYSPVSVQRLIPFWAAHHPTIRFETFLHEAQTSGVIKVIEQQDSNGSISRFVTIQIWPTVRLGQHKHKAR